MKDETSKYLRQAAQVKRIKEELIEELNNMENRRLICKALLIANKMDRS